MSTLTLTSLTFWVASIVALGFGFVAVYSPYQTYGSVELMEFISIICFGIGTTSFIGRLVQWKYCFN